MPSSAVDDSTSSVSMFLSLTQLPHLFTIVLALFQRHYGKAVADALITVRVREEDEADDDLIYTAAELPNAGTTLGALGLAHCRSRSAARDFDDHLDGVIVERFKQDIELRLAFADVFQLAYQFSRMEHVNSVAELTDHIEMARSAGCYLLLSLVS